MIVRWRRRVAAIVATLSLLFVVFLVVTQHQLLFDSSQPRHLLTQHSPDNESRVPLAVSLHTVSSQLDDFQHGVLRPIDRLPTVSTNTTNSRTESGLLQRQFVLHRCPASYAITDTEDAWFRTVVVQRSPPTTQVTFSEEILILTPICNSVERLRRYFENLCSLAYPHRLMTVVLGEDSSSDNTVQVNSCLVMTMMTLMTRNTFYRTSLYPM